jgi:hypothetical protein
MAIACKNLEIGLATGIGTAIFVVVVVVVVVEIEITIEIPSRMRRSKKCTKCILPSCLGLASTIVPDYDNDNDNDKKMTNPAGEHRGSVPTPIFFIIEKLPIRRFAIFS